MAGSTTERGLGWKHQRQRERLIRAHRDGTPCWWCGKPMLRSQELEADHEEARAHGGHQAGRLLHAVCNRQRGDGSRDHLRPTVTGVWSPAGGEPAPPAPTGPPEPRANVLNWP